MPGDSRKDFILVTVANYFGIPINDQAITNLFNAQPLNAFLDDGNISILAAKVEQKNAKRIEFLNKVSTVFNMNFNLLSNVDYYSTNHDKNAEHGYCISHIANHVVEIADTLAEFCCQTQSDKLYPSVY